MQAPPTLRRSEADTTSYVADYLTRSVRRAAGFSLHDELALLVRAGLTPAEALQSATINPVRFLGVERDLGTAEKGKIADLVLLDADPLADIRNTTSIYAVFKSGKEFDRAALDQMLRNAETAAKSAVIH